MNTNLAKPTARRRVSLAWILAWRELASHPRRSVLTLLSIVIGVAAVLAVQMGVGSARRAYQNMSRTIAGKADLEISMVGGGAFELSWLAEVRKTPGVLAALPIIQRPAILYHAEGRFRLVALGIVPQQDAQIRDFEIVAGQTFARSTDVLLDRSLARTAKIQVGDRVRLLARRGRVEVTVAGLIEPRDASAVLGGVVLMPITAAQRRYARRDQIDRIQIVLEENWPAGEVQAELAAKLPRSLTVAAPQTQSQVAEETMRSLDNGLRLATAFSLLAAVFIIMNTFFMSVGQRTPQLAILRAIGATRDQLQGMLLREAFLLGLVGTAGGIVLGIVGARVLNAAMSRLFLAEVPPSRLGVLSLATAVAFGLGVSFLGAFGPAVRVARISPQEGMRGTASTSGRGLARTAIAAGCVLFVFASGMLWATITGLLPIELSVMSTVLLLIALVLLLPLVVRTATRWAAALVRPLMGVEAQIASSQLLRHSSRTVLTAGVLFVAIATGLGLAHSVLDNVADVRQWYRSAIAGDFFVRTANPDMESGVSAAVPDWVGDRIRSIPGIERMVSVRLIASSVGPQKVFVFAYRQIVPEGGSPSTLDVPARPDAELEIGRERIAEGVRIGSVLAQRLGVGPGDSLTLETPHGPKELKIGLVTNDYMVGGLTIHMPREEAESLFEVEGSDAYLITVAQNQRDQVRSAIEALCREQGLLLQSYADLTRLIEQMMAGVVASLWGLMILGLVVAGLGVANTLGMNVLEQTRELSMLRVVGMTRMQVRRTIVVQGWILGLMAVIPGILAGFAMGYVLHLSTLPVLGRAVAHAWHWGLTSGTFLAAMAIVMTAAWFPACRAANLSLPEALRHE